MKQIDINNFRTSNIYLHDAKIGIVSIDHYYNKIVVEIDVSEIKKIVNSKNNTIRLEFEKVKYISVSLFDEWGEAEYISGITLKDINMQDYNFKKLNLDKCFNTNIQLTSGDNIVILSEVLKYFEA
jgi:hypothetical protein